MPENASAKPLFAIVRVDRFQLVDGQLPPDNQWQVIVTVKGLVTSQVEAVAETTRLNRLNGSKGCIYFWQVTQTLERHAEVVGDGSGSGDEEGDLSDRVLDTARGVRDAG